ncbi:MAG TPA: sodium:calcium antiporter [Moraxellaceae bacterium]|nr:sodium:calcium antiporter [Moraxellaceae bacterium]
MSSYFLLFLGMISAGIGGELFVRGTIGLAGLARISPGIIAATIAAFATSSPELSVAINSALAGKPQISLGDALGSNIVNIALILGLALTISQIQSTRDSIKRDFPIALLIPITTGILFLDGELSRVDGLFMLILFVAWLGAVATEANKQRSFTEAVIGEHKLWRVAFSCVTGLTFLIAAGNLIVFGAREIAVSFGINEFIIGATIVAIGTSIPELATTIISKLRGHDEVGLGAILGSNVFNGLFIIAIAAIIHPIKVPWQDIAITLAFGIAAIIVVYPSRDGLIQRGRGILLLATYAAYVITISKVSTV